jgi:hypothetical protein
MLAAAEADLEVQGAIMAEQRSAVTSALGGTAMRGSR